MFKRFVILYLLLLPLYLSSAETFHPVKRVGEWFNEEKEQSDRGFHRFATLATVGTDDRPYTRMVEIVGMSQKNGFLFFTHKNTQKADHLMHNPHASLHVWLPKTSRQFSINGEVKEAPQNVLESAWKRMPRFMKLTFLASEHRGTLISHEILEQRKAKLEELYKDDIPMPTTFIGYHLVPEKVVFYTVKPRNFAEKQVADLSDGKWQLLELEP